MSEIELFENRTVIECLKPLLQSMTKIGTFEIKTTPNSEPTEVSYSDPNVCFYTERHHVRFITIEVQLHSDA